MRFSSAVEQGGAGGDVNDEQIQIDGLDPLLAEQMLAERWQHSPRMLQRWRREGRMPPAIIIGRRVFYRPGDVQAFERRRLAGGSGETRP